MLFLWLHMPLSDSSASSNRRTFALKWQIHYLQRLQNTYLIIPHWFFLIFF